MLMQKAESKQTTAAQDSAAENSNSEAANTDATPKKVKSQKRSWLQKELSGIGFAGTMLALLVLGLIFFIGLRVYINTGYIKSLWEDNQPVTKQRKEFNLVVSNPDDNVLVFDKSLLVTGSSTPKTTVIISTDTDDYAFQTTNNGDFSSSITLSPGLNKITISAFNDTGNSQKQERTVFYSTEQL